VAEWFKAPVLKTGVPARVPWVRIPPLPPEVIENIEQFDFFSVYAQSSVQPVFDTDTIGFFVTLAVLALFFITARMRRR
jgi:hypothetical protein